MNSTQLIQAHEIMKTDERHARLEHDPAFTKGAAFIGGAFCPIDQAAVPIIDCGFTHADAAYDVVSVSRGSFFRLEEHQQRFAEACGKIRVTNPYTREREAEILHELVARTGLQDSYVWWAVTRGFTPSNRADMVDPSKFTNQFYAFAIPYVFIAEDEQRERGLNVAISTERIRIPSTAVDPTAKNFHWLDMQMALFEAGERGSEWAVLTDAEGYLAEATGANIFVVNDGVVLTPDSECLLGITRKTVFDLCDEKGIPWEARRVHGDELRNADDAFLATTAGAVMPISRVDSRPLQHSEKEDKIANLLHDLYWQKRWEGWKSTPVRYSIN